MVSGHALRFTGNCYCGKTYRAPCTIQQIRFFDPHQVN